MSPFYRDAATHPFTDLDRAVLRMDDQRFGRAVDALARYERRQARREAPRGGLDRRGWWWPDPGEASVIRWARAPNPQFPYAYLVACRSLEHCEALEGVDRHATVLVKYWKLAAEARMGVPMDDPRVHRSALGLRLAIEASGEEPPPTTHRRPRL